MQDSQPNNLPTSHTDPWTLDRLVGLVVRRPPREWKIPGSNPACAGIFSGSSHTSDLKSGTPVATLPGAWRCRVSTGTGQPGVSILWLGEVERLICNFHLSVVARKIVWADPSLRYTSLLQKTQSWWYPNTCSNCMQTSTVEVWIRIKWTFPGSFSLLYKNFPDFAFPEMVLFSQIWDNGFPGIPEFPGK